MLIIEDEGRAAQRLQNQLHAYDPTIQVLERLPSVAAVAWLRTHPAPDLLLVDIHLEDDLTFRLFGQVTVGAPVIFTPLYDKYMVQAFKLNSIDYLLKPIDYDELAAAPKRYDRLQQHFAPADLPALLRLVSPAPGPAAYKDLW